MSKVKELIVQCAERAEEAGVAIDGEPLGAVHQWIMHERLCRPEQEFWVVFLLTAEMADREARREGFKNQADRACQTPKFQAALARYKGDDHGGEACRDRNCG